MGWYRESIAIVMARLAFVGAGGPIPTHGQGKLIDETEADAEATMAPNGAANSRFKAPSARVLQEPRRPAPTPAGRRLSGASARARRPPSRRALRDGDTRGDPLNEDEVGQLLLLAPEVRLEAALAAATAVTSLRWLADRVRRVQGSRPGAGVEWGFLEDWSGQLRNARSALARIADFATPADRA